MLLHPLSTDSYQMLKPPSLFFADSLSLLATGHIAKNIQWQYPILLSEKKMIKENCVKHSKIPSFDCVVNMKPRWASGSEA